MPDKKREESPDEPSTEFSTDPATARAGKSVSSTAVRSAKAEKPAAKTFSSPWVEAGKLFGKSREELQEAIKKPDGLGTSIINKQWVQRLRKLNKDTASKVIKSLKD